MTALRNKIAMFQAEEWGLVLIYVLFGIGCCLYLVTDVQEVLFVSCLPSLPYIMWMLTRQFSQQMGGVLDEIQAESLKASDPARAGDVSPKKK